MNSQIRGVQYLISVTLAACTLSTLATPILGCAIEGGSTHYTNECVSAFGGRSVSVSGITDATSSDPYTLFQDSSLDLVGAGDVFSLDYTLQYGNSQYGSLGFDNAQPAQVLYGGTTQNDSPRSSNWALLGNNSSNNPFGIPSVENGGFDANGNSGSSSNAPNPFGVIANSVSGIGETNYGAQLILLDPTGTGPIGLTEIDGTGKVLAEFIIENSDISEPYIHFGDITSAVVPHVLPSGGGLPGLADDDASNMLVIVSVAEPSELLLLLIGLAMLVLTARRRHRSLQTM